MKAASLRKDEFSEKIVGRKDAEYPDDAYRDKTKRRFQIPRDGGTASGQRMDEERIDSSSFH